MLLSTVMTNVSHGPYKSARNFQTIQESAKHFSEVVGPDVWDELVDAIASDRHVSADDDQIPQEPSEFPNMLCFTKLPDFVA